MIQLTDEQRAAVETDARIAVVEAGPGSGKTAVLAARIAWLLDGGASPAELLVVTFTRKAAANMRERAARVIAEQREEISAFATIESVADVYLESAWIGTFHAIGLRMILENAAALGYDADRLVVLDRLEADDVLEDVARDVGAVDRHGKYRAGLSKRRLIRTREKVYYGSRDATLVEEERILRLYRSRLRSMNAIDHGSILLEARDLLRGRLGDKYRERFRHVLVDELQDINAIQFDIVRPILADPSRIIGSSASFFGVGDPRQSIYRFRGADPDVFERFVSSGKLFKISRSFRFGSSIASAAARLSKSEIVGASPGGRFAREVIRIDAQVFGQAVSWLLETPIERGFPADPTVTASDIAVLGRDHRTLRHAGEELEAAGLPVHYAAGSTIESAPMFRQVLAAMRLAVNPRDEAAFSTLRGSLRVGDSVLDLIRRRASSTGRSSFETLGRLAGNLEVSANWELVSIIAGAGRHFGLDRFLGKLPLKAPADPDGLAILDFWRENLLADSTIGDALHWWALRDGQDRIEPVDDAVTLATIHAAKGLEWPVVFVVGLDEGVFPARENSDDIDEDRRVAFVAITRPRELLYLVTNPEWPRSRFLAEMGVE